jgi:hypothetical protein
LKSPRTFGQGVARLARDLTGRSTGDLIGLLGDQLSCTERGARLVVSLAAGSTSTDDARRCMRELEHGGDQARAGLVATLGRVLATPIDAEDMFRLSRSIDDVLDNLRDFVREADLYQPQGLGFALPVAQTLGNETLKRRELLRRLDVVGLRLGEPLMHSPTALSNGAARPPSVPDSPAAGVSRRRDSRRNRAEPQGSATSVIGPAAKAPGHTPKRRLEERRWQIAGHYREGSWPAPT